MLYDDIPITAAELRLDRSVHLSGISSRQVIVTRPLIPFNSIIVDTDQERTAKLAPLQTPQLASVFVQEELSTFWIASPVVPLDTGFLQTLANIQSDARVMIRYSDTGSVDAVKLVETPIGVIGSLPRERIMLFARRTDRLEIVKYSWRWIQESG